MMYNVIKQNILTDHTVQTILDWEHFLWLMSETFLFQVVQLQKHLLIWIL